jgi:predicted dehydrogenase
MLLRPLGKETTAHEDGEFKRGAQHMSGDLRVALVGAGYFARFHAEAWRRMNGAELVAVCDLDLAAAADAAAGIEPFTDVAVMLDAMRPDLLDIATPPATHLAIVEAAAARGVPMVCQKPLAPRASGRWCPGA